MFDVLIREAGARFGLGDKALPLLQMLLADMTRKDTGGLAGFLEKFKAAGLGPIIQSWLGGGPAAQPINNSQLETALGSDGGLLSVLTSRLGVARDSVTSAVGYLLPALVGKLTPGGSIPSALPPQVQALAAAGQGLLDARPVVSAAPAASGGGFTKWLPWIVVALAALFGLSYFATDRGADAPAEQPPAATEPATPEPAASEPATSEPAASEPAASEPATSEPATSEPATPEPATSSEPAAAGATTAPASEPAATTEAGAASGDSAAATPAADAVPSGAAVVAASVGDMPALTVYFDSGATDVHADFAAKSADLVAFLQANPEAQAVISGYNDPTGDAAANAELSRNRAQAVQAALIAQGVAEDRTVLEKPTETSGTAATDAASRRVEVVLRK